MAPEFKSRESRLATVRLAILFGTLYFAQGLCEPTAGLISQPVRSLLGSWGHSTGEIGTFLMLLSAPWWLKPVYGLLSDFVPLAGSRRRSYLIVTSAAAFLGFAALYVVRPSPGETRLLWVLLLIPTIAVAFADVVVDALMVEEGQAGGITGTLQSVQWACLYAAAIVTGVAGGYLSQHCLQHVGFLICGISAAGTLAISIVYVREPARSVQPENLRGVLVALRSALRKPAVLAMAAFLFLWSFNPFLYTVLYVRLTRGLGFPDQFAGTLDTVQAAAAVAACITYGLVWRRVPMRLMIHAAIVLGIASTLAYWALADSTSALVISAAAGFTYMTGSLIQFDLAARVCPVQVAGTLFALLMATSNLSASLAEFTGGWLFDKWGKTVGHPSAFDRLVAIGAAANALCWLLVPILQRAHLSTDSERDELSAD